MAVRVYRAGEIHRCDFCGEVRDERPLYIETTGDGIAACDACAMKLIKATASMLVLVEDRKVVTARIRELDEFFGKRSKRKVRR